MPPEQNLTAGIDAYVGNRNINPAESVPAPREWVYRGRREQPQQIKEENIIRPLSIRQLSHGYIVEVGCQTLAIESASTLIAKLSEYILNPNSTEQKHKEGKLF